MLTDPQLSDLLEALSEETLFKLLQHVQARERRQVLKDDKQGDVEPLQRLLQAVQHYHGLKLRHEADS